MKVELDNVYSLTQARAEFSQLVDSVAKGGYIVITKQNKPKAVLVDYKVFEKLWDSHLRVRLRKLAKRLQKSGSKYVKEQLGDDVSEIEAYRFITGDKDFVV